MSAGISWSPRTCHTGTSRIGPDLAGTPNRFSRGDLFDAILFPSRDVAPAFRVNDVELKNGKVVSGMVIFESADGLIVQVDAVQTIRIDNNDISYRRIGSKSLMPSNLMDDLPPQAVADLYRYLKSLK